MSSTISSPPNKDFGKRRGKWLDQVLDDSKMKGDAFRVMYAIAGRLLDGDTFTSQYGDIAIAKLAHVSVKTVERAIRLAKARGHLDASANKPRVLKPILKSRQNDGTETGQIVRTRLETGQESGQPERGSPVESTGCAPISQDSHKYKKEEEAKNGLPRGASPPEKPARYIPFDSPHWETLARWERKLPPARRPIRDRRGGCWLSETDYKAVNGGGTAVAVSS